MLDIFKLKHGESCQYVILRTTQSTTNQIFKGFKQYIKQRTAFQLLSIKLATARKKCWLGGNRNIHSQNQPNYNSFSMQYTGPRQNSGSPGAKNVSDALENDTNANQGIECSIVGSLKWSHNIALPMMYLLFQRVKQKLCMERYTCFTKVADGFMWFAVLVVFCSSCSIMEY